jgi:hypothetical protein
LAAGNPSLSASLIVTVASAAVLLAASTAVANQKRDRSPA